LYCGLAILLLLWAGRVVLGGAFTWKKCPVSLGLAGLFLFGLWQLAPLSQPWLEALSPGTARLTRELLPAAPEVLPFGEGAVASPLSAGRTISLHPAQTRLEVLRLLAVLLLFAVVRNNCASLAALRRLAVVALVNGFLLALFGLAQFFSAPPQTVYWTIPVLNNPFGPFVCKNHFPFYLNLCIGLGVGLLLFLRRPATGPGRASNLEARPGLLGNLLELLQTPGVLWVAGALAVMIVSVAFSLSRGGISTLVAAAGVCVALRFLQTRRVSLSAAGLLIGAVVVGLLAWLGLGLVQARMATVWRGDALEDVRFSLWRDIVTAVKDFPVWGTGYGTFLYVELTYRSRPEYPISGWDSAHNEYLEALIEGGLVRLLLSLVIIGLVYRCCWRASRRLAGQPEQGLVLGGLFAFTTVVLHSFVDFGLHIPSITLLTTVLTAQLCAIGAASQESGVRSQESGGRGQGCSSSGEEKGTVFRLGGLAPLAALVVAVALGGILCAEGWRLARTDALEVAAGHIETGLQDDGESIRRRLDLLEAASGLSPESAQVHLVAGQAWMDLYQARREQRQARERNRAGEEAELAPRYLVPALRHYLHARDLCPLIAKTHVRIAAGVEWFEKADPRSEYLRRAKRACSCDPEVWYLAGVLELKDQQKQQACSSWRRSLELSQQFLTPILERAGKVFGRGELIEKVLPAQADTLLAAAAQLYPEPGEPERRPFLEKARAVLAAKSAPLTAEELHVRARTELELGDWAAASRSYTAALLRAPNEVDWRCEYAALLRRQGKLKESRQELLTVLGQQPHHAQALDLLEKVAEELAEGK
jgi:O-antigen ligase/tetratricopeptide (TPR) repeat protein